jgi:hypothetical protein
VSDYNAQIDVESAVGRGTTFRVTFPPILEGQLTAADTRPAVAADAPREPESPRRSSDSSVRLVPAAWRGPDAGVRVQQTTQAR